MSSSDLQGRWMPSSLTEEDISKLREARFITSEISHRLPVRGQVIPSPQPGESVVFVSHFLRGLGFSTDPFVRGLMFYYGLEFHDLAPESILHISSFIVVYEAFLHVTPHFGLWLKTFKVEPKIIEGRHAECGGAVIKRNTDAPWPEGTFQEELSLWQQEWFYITSPRGTTWVAPPAFRSGPPTTFNIVDQHSVRSGLAQRRSSVAGPHKGSPKRRPQPGQGDTSYADSPDTARPTSPPPLVGVQPRGAASSPKFHGRDAYGDV